MLLEYFKNFYSSSSDTWTNGDELRKIINKLLNIKSKDKIPVLTISDFNTKDFMGREFKKLILISNFSNHKVKSQYLSEMSAGTYGHGKMHL